MYPLTFFVKSLPPGVGGCANGPVIRILEKYKDDRGIYEHELTHVMQWFYGATLGFPVFYALLHYQRLDLYWLAVLPLAFHSLLYKFAPAYRLWAEVQAYKEQLKHYPDDRSELFGGYIANSYKLKISPSEAASLLK